ncbi:ribonuclease HII [Candidatus Saccharibacteria bacterium]|nr:ribonuclease HII [Candidatus Saccharibacteria bacterium]
MAILGIDEVGRGPLAGPLVVGAVVLPEEEREWFLRLRDSKKLSAKRREELSGLILAEAATGLGWVSPEELDKVGISEALRLATRRAVKSVQRLHVPFSQIIIDGKVNFLTGTSLEKYVTTVVKADDLIRGVSAASIIAKVARDRYMVEAAERFSGYGFERNVGYGTAEHLKAIREIGICSEHRQSFEPIKSMVGFSREEDVVKNTTKIGNLGEEAVAEYLVRKGHKIVARNFKTKFYEIDIISVFDDKIYFTEVKTRKSEEFGGGISAVNQQKIKQMRFAAESFMKFRAKEFKQFSPILAVAAVNGKYEVLDYVLVLD